MGKRVCGPEARWPESRVRIEHGGRRTSPTLHIEAMRLTVRCPQIRAEDLFFPRSDYVLTKAYDHTLAVIFGRRRPPWPTARYRGESRDVVDSSEGVDPREPDECVDLLEPFYGSHRLDRAN